MVRLIDPIQEAIENWGKLQKDIHILNEIEKQGFISDGLKKYFTSLIILDRLSKEVEAYVLKDNLEEANQSLSEMRKFLLRILYNYSKNMIKKPKLRAFHKEIYNFAYKKYKNTINKLDEILI